MSLRWRVGRLQVALPLLLALGAPGACGRRSGGGGGTGGLGGEHGSGGRSATGGAATGGAATGGVGSGGRTAASGGGGGAGAPDAGSVNDLGTGAAGTGGTAGAGGSSGAGGEIIVSDAGADDAADAPVTPDASPGQPLGLNDVTILTPLPSSSATPVLLWGGDLAGDGTPLVPRPLFDRLIVVGGRTLPTLDKAYERLHLVAVRFDLCDRHLPGPCPPEEDGRLRLVFQPFAASAPLADDVGFHVFYSIRNDELAGAVAELRDLARGAVDPGGILRVSPSLGAAAPAAYADEVRAFVRRYSGDARFVRLTMNAQDLTSEALLWFMSGVEKKGAEFVDMPVTGTGGTELSQRVFSSGSPSFDLQPMTDKPPGLLGAIIYSRFVAADVATQRNYLSALAAVDNPLSHTAETVPCVACHVSTPVIHSRAARFALDPATLPGRYTSTFDLSTAGGISQEIPTITRALGYRARLPFVSQRVVNETAQVLVEIEARFPAR